MVLCNNARNNRHKNLNSHHQFYHQKFTMKLPSAQMIFWFSFTASSTVKITIFRSEILKIQAHFGRDTPGSIHRTLFLVVICLQSGHFCPIFRHLFCLKTEDTIVQISDIYCICCSPCLFYCMTVNDQNQDFGPFFINSLQSGSDVYCTKQIHQKN